MPHLQLNVLGQFHCALDGTVLRSFESDKVRALLVFLAVEQEQALSRSSLATLLWPDFGEESARANLRQALYQLRQVLGDERAETPLILTSRQTIQWNPLAAAGVDVTSFRRLLAESAQHDHLCLEGCEQCLQRLQQAAELYLGDFLAGFAVAESEGFEEWRRIQQEQLHVQAIDLFHQLTVAFEVRRDYASAQRFAQRLLHLEPWREEAHRQLMRIYAQQGQRAAALAQYQSCLQALQQEFGIEPEAATVQLYKEILSGKFASDSSINTTPATESAAPIAIPHNLPAQSTPFIGRAQELTELLTLVAQPEHRLITLLGPGGIGKTRMALEAAQQLLAAPHSQFADGIFFVSLAPLATSEPLIPAVAAALGIELYGSDLQKALLKLLQPKQLLLILDNFEHLLDGAGRVTEILQQAAHVQILVTSRARLNLHGETCYQVQPLTESSTTTVQGALNSDAVRLFLQSAKRSYADFVITENNLAAVLRICRSVEGMPLGLEMAASWIQWLPVAEIAKEIEQSSDFLTVDWVDTPARQRSMWAVFEWSWKLLSPQEQTIFAALSVFRGGFGHEAAAQITGASLRSLISLANKSLLHVTRLPGEPARYQVHELLRQFAAQQLEIQRGERAAIFAKHSAYYLAFLAEREFRLARNDLRQAVAEIRSEIDNIRQAWIEATNLRQFAWLDQGISGLARFYDLVGLHSETIQIFGQSAVRLETLQTPPPDAAESQVGPQQFLSKLLALQAAALMKIGRFDEGKAVAQRAALLGERSGGLVGELYAQLVMAQWLYRKGNYSEARAAFHTLVQRLAQLRQPDTGSELLNDVAYSVHVWLGSVESEVGNFAVAEAHYAQGIRICQALNKLRSEVHVRINLADMFRRTYQYPKARAIYEESLRNLYNLDYHWAEGEGHIELADVVRMMGEYSLARHLLLRGEMLMGKSGFTLEQTYSHIGLARLYGYLGDFEQANHWLERLFASPVLQESSWIRFNVFSMRAMLAYLLDDIPSLLSDAQQALNLGQLLKNPQFEAHGLLLLAHGQRELKAFDAAAENYQAAHRLYLAINNQAVAAEASAGLALLAWQQGEIERSQPLVEELLLILDGQHQIGLDEPFFTYLACYQILAAQHDPRASALLQSARHQLHHYADQIDEEELRRSFLEGVSLHRQIHSL